MPVDANSVVPMYRQLADLLRRQIAAGDLGDGDRLPSEAQLGEAHGVSRITVRQALADLERLGLVDRVVGKGTFVRTRPRPIEALGRLSGFGEQARAAGVAAGYLVLATGEAPLRSLRGVCPSVKAAWSNTCMRATGRPSRASSVPLSDPRSSIHQSPDSSRVRRAWRGDT